MKEALEHWKEGASVLAYFGFLAFFTPKAEALGWGYKGILFCVLVGALLVSLVYLVVRCIAEYLADHREVEEDVQAHSGKVAAIIGDNQRRRLRLAENFQPDANDPLATGVFLAGIPGSGKTVTLALFLEQYIKLFRLAVVIFDIAGDLRSIVEDGLCPRGLIATQDSMPSMALVVQHRMQVIVDLQQCRRPGEAFINYELAAQLIAKTIKDIMNAQSAINPNDRLPCLIGLDETHIWAPQNPPSYLDPKTAKDLLDTLTVVATTGRKYGVVPFLAAQRIPKVHKDIIAGCETRLLGKADLDNDIKRYREYVSPDVISDQGIRQLSKGRMVVCMGGKRLIVQFYQRESRHISHTPGVTQALNNLVGRIPPELLASITRPVEVIHPASTPPYVPQSVPTHNEVSAEAQTPSKEPSRSGSLTAIAAE